MFIKFIFFCETIKVTNLSNKKKLSEQNKLFCYRFNAITLCLKKSKDFWTTEKLYSKKKENNTTYLILWLQERLIVVNLF